MSIRQDFSTNVGSTKTMKKLPLLITAAFLCMAGAASAQSNFGTIVGVVKDASKLPIAGATIIAVKEDGGGIRSTISSSDGVYSVSRPGARNVHGEGANAGASRLCACIAEGSDGRRDASRHYGCTQRRRQRGCIQAASGTAGDHGVADTSAGRGIWHADGRCAGSASGIPGTAGTGRSARSSSRARRSGSRSGHTVRGL